ncbi:hypothetical protein B0H19DRAFT_1137049 [Mycena capillaripes]|nr:hypothetical protein B0H19DRAFT_1137049 [Mycena capillaripes]
MSLVSIPTGNLPHSCTAGDAPPGQLNIAIIGAGLVGLATAAMLRKQGHRITIFESSSFHAEIGAGITLTPNGVAVIKDLLPELNWESMRAVDLRSVEMFNADGTHTNSIDLSEAWASFPQGWYMIHRVDLHKALMHLALDAGAHSFPPAVIRLGTPISTVNFDSTCPSVTTSMGEDVGFDLILAADGIKSTVRRCMIGAQYDAPESPMAFYRWMIDLKTNPELSWIRDNRKTPGPRTHGDLINVSAAHFDKRENKDAVDWNAEVPMETFLESFADFGEKFMSLVTVAEKPRVWQLRSMSTLPTWTKGNVALLGDAAHAMRPTYGQGFAMGLEDAAMITTLFPSGIDPSEIPGRLKAFGEIRKPRAEQMSYLSTEGVKLPMSTLFGSSWVVPKWLGYDFAGIAKAHLSKS